MPARLPYLLEHRIHQLGKQGLTAQEIANTLGDDSPSRQSIIRIRDLGVRPTLNNRLSSPETIGYAVAAVLVENQTHTTVAKALKVPNDSIGRWLKQARIDLAGTDTTDFDTVERATIAAVSTRRTNGRKRSAATAAQRPTTPPQPHTSDPSVLEALTAAASTTPPMPLTPADLPDNLADAHRMLHEQQLRLAIAEAKVVVLGKDDGPLSNKEATETVDYLRTHGYRCGELLHALGLSSSSYARWRTKLIRPRIDPRARVRALIIDCATLVREQVRSTGFVYGYRKIHALLKNQGVRVSEKIVRAIMTEHQLCPTRKRTATYSSYAGEISPGPANLVRVNDAGVLPAAQQPSQEFIRRYRANLRRTLTHDFHADRPWVKIVTDITEFSCADGKLYFSPAIDCHDFMPIAATVSHRPAAVLATEMLREVLDQAPAGSCPIVHTDRGLQYRSGRWASMATQPGPDNLVVRRFVPSMSRKGKSGDNAVAEGFFGTLKREMFPGGRREIELLTRAEVTGRLEDYLEFFVHQRLSTRLSYRTIAEHRELDSVRLQPAG